VDVLLPRNWSPPIGYANGVAAAPGRIVFVAGQVGWDEHQQFHSAELVPQFEQALKNVLAVLAEAGGKPEHICRMTAYCSDKPAYLAGRPRRNDGPGSADSRVTRVRSPGCAKVESAACPSLPQPPR